MQHLTFLERHTQLLKINDLNCLNLSPLSALQLDSDVCFCSDTQQGVFRTEYKEGRGVRQKEYPMSFNESQVYLVLRT